MSETKPSAVKLPLSMLGVGLIMGAIIVSEFQDDSLVQQLTASQAQAVTLTESLATVQAALDAASKKGHGDRKKIATDRVEKAEFSAELKHCYESVEMWKTKNRCRQQPLPERLYPLHETCQQAWIDCDWKKAHLFKSERLGTRYSCDVQVESCLSVLEAGQPENGRGY